MRSALLALVPLLVAGFPLASAHPFTDETIPVQFSSVPAGTSEVIVAYSEAIEISFSELKVFDGSGDRIDNRDTTYHTGDYSLVVTTPPLEDGVYTVTSKVLSRVDGHLVDYAFVFAVGDAAIDRDAADVQADTELIFFPEAGSRFPGLVGQTIVLGSIIASMFVWGTQRKDLAGDRLAGLQKAFHGRFVSLVGFGLVIVFASNILMLTVHTLRLEASALDAIQTSFGTTWAIRMAVTVALLGVWFVIERTGLSLKNQVALLALSLALIGTTTMMGHGMASGQAAAVILDYTHNLVSAAWIGGIIFFAFALLPSLGILGSVGERMSLAAIPRFSIMITIAVGVVVVSGPTLMWFLESDVGMIIESTYGRLIIAKILLAGAMIGIGGYHQFVTQRGAERGARGGAVPVIGSLRRALKAEIILGVILLGVVALLTNGTLPEGEVRTAQAQEAIRGLSIIEFSENARFEIEIFPFTSGANSISVRAADPAGGELPDLGNVKVKVSNPQRNISPIMVPVERDGDTFRGDVTFGFSGQWQLEVEAQRMEAANEARTLNLLVKPALDDLKTEITEYPLPEPGAPLHLEFDDAGDVWITDSSAPRLWKFSVASEEFTRYDFEGQASITLDVGADGKVWYTDIPEGRIGYVDPASGESGTVEFPDIIPVIDRNYPITLDVDDAGGIWASIANKNVIVRYDQHMGEFDVYELPTADSGPFAVAIDDTGRVWFSQQSAGQIGYIEPGSGKVFEFIPEIPLATPETITFDAAGGLWIAEHQEGGGITRYDPLLGTFERIPAPDGAAFPNSASIDRYQNVWFAMHTVDKLAAYDPQRGQAIEVPIPSAESWVQFTAPDGDGNIWFVEQKPAKLAVLRLTEVPGMVAVPQEEAIRGIRYAELASPLVALGIVAASLFFVKGVGDKRRINSLVYEEGA